MLFLVILVASFLVQLLFPWWIIAPVAAVLSFWKSRSGKHAALSSFFAVLVLWGGMALVKSIPNEHILLNRVVVLFGLSAGVGSRILIVVVTSCIGGIAAAIGGWAGWYWKIALRKK